MIVNRFALLKAKPIRNMLDRKYTHPGIPGSYGLGEIGYDIRINQDIRFHIDETGPVIQIRHKDGRVEHCNGRFCLASSVEYFQIPSNLGAIGHDKSTLARMGVQVFNTVMEPGWRGHLTIELVFNGEQPVHIPAGSGIMQVIFHELAEPVVYEGKYQDQPDAPVPAKI